MKANEGDRIEAEVRVRSKHVHMYIDIYKKYVPRYNYRVTLDRIIFQSLFTFNIFIK